MASEKLEKLASRAASSGVFLDFDGTLSEIAAMPAAARAIPGVAEVLSSLAQSFRVVAVVSGRMVAEVAQRVGRPPGVLLFGLYGVETPGSEGPGGSPRQIEEILPRILELSAGVEGSLVEPKGSHVAVHYRLSPDPEAARTTLLGALRPLAEVAGLELIEGKRVLELVPKTSPTKGDLVQREAAELEAVLYAGDDLADMEAFEALDRLAVEGVETVKVAVRSAETPQALVDAADAVVEGPSGLLELLRTLVR